ncbi:MAG: prolipoprotein diacylglyceryl transferase [Actinomycetota bacterium]|nr:prolipoprotein diacylglyceryl transferase [Actinomycetota bacterium]
MSPVLVRFALGGREVVVGSYAAFYTLAWVLSPLAGVWLASRRGLPARRVAALYYLALAAGIIGARVFDLGIAWRFYAEDPSRIWSLSFQGFSLYGGLVAATLTGIALARMRRLPVWALADSAVPALMLGDVLMRTGCFLRGCCFGTVTTTPLGVKFPMGSPSWAQQMLNGQIGVMGLVGQLKPVHPTQLYEMAGALIVGAAALWVMSRTRRDGVGFLVFAIGFTLVRLGNGYLRVRQSVITVPEWFYPVFYSALALIMLGLLLLRLRSTPRPPRLPWDD